MQYLTPMKNNNNKRKATSMRKLGELLGKTTAQTKTLAKTTAVVSKNALAQTKETLVNAKSDFVAGYKEQSKNTSDITDELEVVSDNQHPNA
jgi:ferritin